MARRAREALADTRALEEQMERVNPINPKREIGDTTGYLGLIKGSGATPSMGLSTKRGGARRKPKVEEAVVELEGGAGMGEALGSHLLSLHGRGFFDDFAKGFMSVVKPIASVASFIPGPIGTVARVASGLMGGADTGAYEGEGTKKGEMRKTARKAYMKGGAYTMDMRGRTVVVSVDGRPIGEFATMAEAKRFVAQHRRDTKKGREAIGATGETGAFRAPAATIVPSGMRTPTDQPTRPRNLAPKRKGIAHKSGEESTDDEAEGKGKLTITHGGAKMDGRKKRAEVVKRVMKERGLSMIDASKYVKAHGLY